jgi:hypothetical protein
MKYLMCCFIFLAGCDNTTKQPVPLKDTKGVIKFTDGDVTCYMLYQSGISCLRTTP